VNTVVSAVRRQTKCHAAHTCIPTRISFSKSVLQNKEQIILQQGHNLKSVPPFKDQMLDLHDNKKNLNVNNQNLRRSLYDFLAYILNVL